VLGVGLVDGAPMPPMPDANAPAAGALYRAVLRLAGDTG
jgi:hypothetical protein